MPKKSKDIPVEQTDNEVEPVKKVKKVASKPEPKPEPKKKKVLSEKQKENLLKGQEALKKKRETKKAEEQKK